VIALDYTTANMLPHSISDCWPSFRDFLDGKEVRAVGWRKGTASSYLLNSSDLLGPRAPRPQMSAQREQETSPCGNFKNRRGRSPSTGVRAARSLRAGRPRSQQITWAS